jgi:hypothetical protein
VIGVLTALWPAIGHAQSAVEYPTFETTETVTSGDTVPPMTKRERINWIVEGVVQPRNLAITAFSRPTSSGRHQAISRAR